MVLRYAKRHVYTTLEAIKQKADMEAEHMGPPPWENHV